MFPINGRRLLKPELIGIVHYDTILEQWVMLPTLGLDTEDLRGILPGVGFNK